MITDEIWTQLQSTMESHGCYDTKNSRDIMEVIPRKSNSKKPNPEFDSFLYKRRHLVENLFARLKHYRKSPKNPAVVHRFFHTLVDQGGQMSPAQSVEIGKHPIPY